MRRGAGGGGVVGPGPVDEDVARELESHVALRAEELERAGWPPAEARAEAIRLLGDREAVARECVEIARSHRRAVRRVKRMEEFGQDLRYAVRSLLASPGFAVVAIVTLALGIGANTAIFSVVDGVLLEPLPFEDPDELVWVRETTNRGGTMAAAWLNVVDWDAQSTSFDGVAGYTTGTTTVLGGERPVRARLSSIGPAFWEVLPVAPLQGRTHVRADHLAGAEPVAVVSEGFWRNELGGRPLDELSLETAGVPFRVVGVVPSSFDYPAGTEIWGPVVDSSDNRTAHSYSVIARLRDGVTLSRAAEELDALTRRLVATEPGADPDFLATGARVTPLREAIVGDSRGPLVMLLAAAGLVLLIACTNLASTLLARGTTRERELAVRAALGAGRGRIVRQLLTESALLAVGGALVGVATAWLVVRGLVSGHATAVPRLAEVGIDGTVLAFTAGIALLTATLFGLAPALRFGTTEAAGALRAGSRGNATGGRGRTWSLLVGTEVALALVLLVGSGLLIRSLQQLLAEDAGFDASDVVVTPVSLSRIEYGTAGEHALWYQDFIRRLDALAGTEGSAVVSTMPAGGGVPNGRMELDGDVEKHAVGGYVVVNGSAFEVLDIPLLRGRTFDDRDTPDGEHVAIVSQSFVDEYWPDEDPLGRTVTGGGMDDYWQSRRFARVVGVVGDVRYRSLGEEPIPTVYFPYTQRPFRLQFGANVLTEASGDPAAVMAAIRSSLQAAEPDVPARLQTMADFVGQSLADRRFVILILGGFSLVALLLAGVGIYGVVSYSVARRTREMGIRLALGAERGSVVRMVFARALSVVGLGVAVGVIASLALSGSVETLLYGVDPGDPVTLVAVSAILLGTAVLATWIPAARGTRVDPMVTMRAE